MEEIGCEHLEGSPIGKCAICERMVCSECYRDLFSAMICDMHEHLEDEAEWELVGYYTDTSSLDERRYTLEESSITSLVVESDEESVELYVPAEVKDDAFEALSAGVEDENSCSDCKVQYSADMSVCPVCGVKSVEDHRD